MSTAMEQRIVLWSRGCKDASLANELWTTIIKNSITNNEKHIEVAEWCKDNLCQQWIVGDEYSAFESEDEAIQFKLRW